ncbi:unnamed protein product [Vitrella brassicaformis CCMP3155]|uniref:Uncharacterized protein n=1 Tax=Vitrella brassicaformis (strain CCMP3155) TaxID=1169540 RepID=A0A0G4EUL1_VITBC|nr:unnamed protein product [Vitrella brassicaformis CCMP3155]|eukprot:CEM02123.1 unnamed protein product [Vitrella brassicaformis CCMP3155]
MLPHPCVVLASFHVLALLSCLPGTLGWRHNVSAGAGIGPGQAILGSQDFPVPTVLLGCHFPIHDLRNELVYLFSQPEGPSDISGWTWDAYLRDLAFIDWIKDASAAPEDRGPPEKTMPRKLSGYFTERGAVQYETEDHRYVYDVRNFTETTRRNPGLLWEGFTESRLPHFRQLDLADKKQVASAHQNLHLPLNHFNVAVLVYCPQDIFWQPS